MGLHSVACCLLEGGSPSCLPDSHLLRPQGDFYLYFKARLDFSTKVKDNRGNTPLMIAILSGNLDAVKVVNIMFRLLLCSFATQVMMLTARNWRLNGYLL